MRYPRKTRKTPANKIPEFIVQQSIVRWFRVQHSDKLIFSVPNEGANSARATSKLKKIGLLAGAPDLVVCLPSKTIFVEVKRKDGYQRPNQEIVEARLCNLGLDYFLVKSLEDFMELIDSELKRIKGDN